MAKAGGKAKQKYRSVKWKIFTFMLGFCLLMLVILWLFQTVFLQSFYTAIKLSQVEDEAVRLAAMVEAGDLTGVEQAIHTRGDMLVELVDETGASTLFDGFMPELDMGRWGTDQLREIYQQAAENGGSLSQRYNFQSFLDKAPPGGDMRPPDGRHGDDTVLHATLVTTPEGAQYMLLVRASITPVSATVDTLRAQLFIISGIMLVLAVGIALIIAQIVSRPIVKLNESATELGRGNYDVTFKGEGYREVAELSDTLNTTAKELGKTEELRRDLIANVSHDLRTPLTLITGYAEMMRDIPGENNPENMQVIIDEAKRLSTLVGDLLDLSRLQSGTSDLNIERFDLTDEVSGIIERFQKFSEPEGYSVAFINDNGHILVDADAGRIGQVVYNFLINAMTHGGEDKAITVRQTPQNGRVRVEVADTGPGIAPDKLPYIWDRYYKVDTEHKRPLTGTGLGLSIVKGILEQHPGIEYGVESKEGHGSVFWFSLPVAAGTQ